MKKFVLFCLLLLISFSFVGWYSQNLRSAILSGYIRTTQKTARIQLKMGNIAIGDSVYADTLDQLILMPVYNGSGGALARGDCVAWDNTSEAITAKITRSKATETLTIDLSGAAINAPLQILAKYTDDSNDTEVILQGLGWDGTAVVETLEFTTDANKLSVNRWDSLAYCIVENFSVDEDVELDGYVLQSVEGLASADNQLAAGVIFGLDLIGTNDTIPDSTWGYLAIGGIMDSVKVDGSSTAGLPGMVVHLGGTAKIGIPDGTPVTSATIGRLLEAITTNGRAKVYINPGG
jgi:hypothetical protein